MSVKAMGRVWDLKLPHNKLLVLLAMADHADHEGRDIFPSTDLIAWKTGYSDRQVQRVIDALIADGILIVVKEARQQRPTTYAIDFSAAPLKSPFRDEKPKQGRQNVTSQGRQNVTTEKSRGDILTQPGVTFCQSRGDIAMSPEPWNHHVEPSPPTAPAEKNGGGGGDLNFYQELRKRRVGSTKAREIADRYPQDADRILGILDRRKLDSNSKEFGRLLNDIADGVATDAPPAQVNGHLNAPHRADLPTAPAPLSSMAKLAQERRNQ